MFKFSAYYLKIGHIPVMTHSCFKVPMKLQGTFFAVKDLADGISALDENSLKLHLDLSNTER